MKRIGFFILLYALLFLSSCGHEQSPDYVNHESEPSNNVIVLEPTPSYEPQDIPPKQQDPIVSDTLPPGNIPDISLWEGGRPGFGGRISAGQWGHFYVDLYGNLWGWGVFGRVLMGEKEGLIPLRIRVTPELVMDNVSAVCAGGWGGWGMHVMVIRTDGSLWALGSNSEGQLGDGNSTWPGGPGLPPFYAADRDEPVHIMDDVVAVSTGGGHTMAIKSDGSLWGWGSNNFGQVGDGTTTMRTTPVRVKENVIAVSAGSSYTMAITSDNTLWAWGMNNNGQLGYARTAEIMNYYHTEHLRVMDNAAQVSAGFGHTMVIKTDGSLWAFGSNHWGVLGGGLPDVLPQHSWDHAPVAQAQPVWVMDNVTAVSAGDYDSMALTADGKLWIWGAMSGWFQLGPPVPGADDVLDLQMQRNLISAIPFNIADRVTAISASNGGTMLFLHEDGSVLNFGHNSLGQMGNGQTGGESTRREIINVFLPRE